MLVASIPYAFLSLQIGFKYPFYAKNDEFTLKSSDGTHTPVTSFSTSTELWDPNSDNVRSQVEILCYRDKFGGRRSTPEFAVDLCRHTKPYQVVLASVPRQRTLGETLAAAQEKILEFEQNPGREDLSKLRYMDELIVPDVLYNLIHHFHEMEGKGLVDLEGRSFAYYIFEARQVVKFSLGRRGVVLKSEARIGGAGGLPRLLSFDSPFLIYVKKRGAEFSPFFVMWVDNAELMQEF